MCEGTSDKIKKFWAHAMLWSNALFAEFSDYAFGDVSKQQEQKHNFFEFQFED